MDMNIQSENNQIKTDDGKFGTRGGDVLDRQ